MDKKCNRNFLKMVLFKVVGLIDFLNKNKLVHRKLSLDKVLIMGKGNSISKIRFTGVNYLKEYNAEYLEEKGWLSVSKRMEAEETINEKTNILSFGEFLEELLNLLDKPKAFDEYYSSLEKLYKKCLM